MIPKVIHYCWFGKNNLPESAKECIASWKKFLPDYEIKEWNEDNFNVNINTYTAEAYKAKNGKNIETILCGIGDGAFSESL